MAAQKARPVSLISWRSLLNRFLTSVLAVVFSASLGTLGFAATGTPAPAASSSSMSSMKASTSCPAGEKYVKPYTKSDGTKVAGYCRASKSAMASTSCPKGETWVAPYTKSDGTKVKGYCRSSTSSSMGTPAPSKT
jgi:hypothetical protein